MSQTKSSNIKELFDKIHPNKRDLNIPIYQFLLKLGVQTIEDLVKADLMLLLKKVEETIPNYIELIDIYWQYFLQVAYMDYRRASYPKDPTWNENFDEVFTTFIRGISGIHYFQDVLGFKGCLETEFEDFRNEYVKVITVQEKFTERANKEIKIMSKFVEETMAQINSRKILSQSEIQEREKQLQYLKALFSEYDKFNLIIVKDTSWLDEGGSCLNFRDSCWLDDIGGHLKIHINFIESLKLENLIPWTDKEIVKTFLLFWKYKALA